MSHVGIKALWESGDWQKMLQSTELSDSPLLVANPTSLQRRQAWNEFEAGVRRGLLEAVLSLTVTQDVSGSLERVRGRR